MQPSSLLELVNHTLDRKKGAKAEYYAPSSHLILIRHFAPTRFEAFIYEPLVCLILQGCKETVFDERSFSVARGQSVIISHDLVVSARITTASLKTPYVALVFKLDLATLRNLYESGDVHDSDRGEAASIEVDRFDDETVDALRRYLVLTGNPAEMTVLGPLVFKELHYRVLSAPHAGMLRRLMWRKSRASNIFRAIQDIRENFKESLAIPVVAKSVGMGVSSFHTHFKSITGTTPLQYQKDLRLMEAKQILLMGRHSVSSAAFEVGYESPTQFSREYKRKFGCSPAAELSLNNKSRSSVK